nr:heavy-metal-associated domain-containing protein [Saccharibacillus qingshengii]
MTQAIFQLEPLGCPSCIQKIETMLKRTAGVESATVLFHASKVKTVFDPKRIAADEIRTRIERLGYPVLAVRTA